MKFLIALIVMTFLPFLFWYVATPRAILHLAEGGVREVRYQWNTNNRIYRGTLHAGRRATEPGELFPKEDFYMVVDWWRSQDDIGRCVMVTPVWYGTNIYLNADGDVAQGPDSGTDLERIKICTVQAERVAGCEPCTR
jgi:hypothetical protein